MEGNGASKLAEALAKAQAEFQPAEKDKVNPHFGSRFASLGSITKATRAALTKNGLAVSQHPGRTQTGVTCESVLRHPGGETLSATAEVPFASVNAQAYGSALTYARRYSYAALLQIEIDEDDDANAASAPPMPASKAPPRKMPIQDVAPEEPPHPAEELSLTPSPRERPPAIVFRFGKSKGQNSHAVPDETLAWYLKVAEAAMKDETKARFLEANRKEFVLLEAEVKWRAEGRA